MCRPHNICFDETRGDGHHSYACTVSNWDSPKCPWRCFGREENSLNYTFTACEEDPSLIQCTVSSFTTCFPKTDVAYQIGTRKYARSSSPQPTLQTTSLPEPPTTKSRFPYPPNPPLPENSSQSSAVASPAASGIPEQGRPLDDRNTKAIRIGVAVGREARHQQTAVDIQASPDADAETTATATCDKPAEMGHAARFPVELDSQLVSEVEADLPRYELDGGEVEGSNSQIQPEDPGKETGVDAGGNAEQKLAVDERSV